jgi:hypothetical protein
MSKSKEEFFAAVRKVKSTEIFPNVGFSKHNDHCVLVTRPDGVEQAVNFVSGRYGLLENTEFFPALEQKLTENGFRFTPAYDHVDYCKYYATYQIEGRDLMIGQTKYADKIMPMMKIMRSYSSQIGFRIVFGFYRQICSNGLWGYKWVQQANLKHTVGNLDKMYQTITTSIQKFLDEAKDLTEVYQVIGDREVTHWTDRVQEVIAATSFPLKSAEEVINRINFEHNSNGLPITDWLIYNGFNYQLSHSEGMGASPEARVELDREVFSHILNKPFDAKFEVAELV